MKKKNVNKKIFSAIAVLAISATAVGSAISFSACGDKSQKPETSSKGRVTINTVLGTAYATESGNVYYTAPDGKSGATGTMEDPFNITDVLNTDKLNAGDTLYVLPGIYDLSTGIRMMRTNSIGTFDKYIRIVNAALEEASGYTGTETRATLDFSRMSFNSANRGVQIDTDFVHWYGIDVCGAGDNGLYVGGSYNTIEFCEFYNNRDTGLQLGRSYADYNSIDQWPSYNLVKDCTSHNNYDNETYGENADGFAAKLTVGYSNVFDGCIAYRNSDDGWDLYAKTDSGNIGTVIMYNCVAYENGYLEYTRDECNSLYPTYDKETFDKNETSTNQYMTRDGDGNGFKLGGSIMEGDVLMYNCLSYGNRMHGVTDNSNPGYLKLIGITSFNNSAAINADGQVDAVLNKENHSNIDVSRQTYSYNAVNNVLSVRDGFAKSLDSDNYRGTVYNSLLDANTKTNVINGSIEADTRNSGGKVNVSQIDALSAASLFKKLPIVQDGETLTYNMSGLRDSMTIAEGKVTGLLETRAHLIYRNPDHSINMGEVLDKSVEGEALISSYLGAGVTAGSDLDKGSWTEYTHFYNDDFVNGDAESADKAVAERIKEALTLNCDENAVYQDFDVPTEMVEAEITWSTDSDEILVIKDDVTASVSGTKYITVEVYRPADADTEVTLVATIKYNDVTVTKEFKLNIKSGKPSVGEIYVTDAYGVRVVNGGRYIVDQFKVMNEPKVSAKNGLYVDSEKVLKETEYDVETTYMYQTDSNAHAVEIKEFTPSVAGVYTISHKVTLKADNSKQNSMSYQIFVANSTASVDFVGDANVSAYQGGFIISGEPSSATGSLFAVTSATELSATEINAANIKNFSGVESYKFRDTSISFKFNNANRAEYYIYYALANGNGEITSEVYSVKISKVDIDSTDKFIKMAGGAALGDEVPSQTIYALTADLDFTGVNFTIGKSTFTGVFNGMGHTISNLSVSSDSSDKNIGVFYKISGGTIMNVKFDKLSIASSSGEKVGLVSECSGGYFYNIAFTNVSLTGGASRASALIGHVGDGAYDVNISQVSIVNDADHKLIGATRVGGLIGYVQNYYKTISIDNCYVITDIDMTSGEGGGMVASWEDKPGDVLIITQCYYSGNIKTPVAPGSSRLGGMLGYHKGGQGTLNVSRCISLATYNIQGTEMLFSVKNASPIIGQFSVSQNTVVSVTNCIGLMDEYNTDFDVAVFTTTNLRRNGEYITSTLKLDLTRWTIVEADEPDKHKDDLYKAPYVVLNFLGDWN